MKSIQRIFIPGDKWLYVKLYTGNKTADNLLIDIIMPIVKELLKEQIIDKWFFIRYSDPNFHLRIRFLMKNDQSAATIIHMLYKRLNFYVVHNLVWKVQYDVYNRELERYGNDLIEESESIFQMDSDCVLFLIKKLQSIPDENFRWMIALKMIDELLSDFAIDIFNKKELMDKLSDSYKNEFGFTRYNSKQFNIKFREHRKCIDSILKGTFTEPVFLSLYLPIRKRSKRSKLIIERIYIKLNKARTDITIQSLLSSYIHMMMNRLFRSKNRMHELVIYDFMRRYYNSEIAKLNNKLID